jgi:tRNA dimethylallyltransferase
VPKPNNQSDTRLLRARWVFPASSPPIRDGVVSIHHQRITAVGKGPAGSEVEDLGNVAILPGLVNAHTHLEFSSLPAPLGKPGMGFVDWLRLVLNHRRQSQPGDARAVELGLAESLRSGTTALGEITQPAPGTVPIFAQPGTVPIFAQRKWDCPLPELTIFLELLAPTTARIPPAMELAERHLQLAAGSTTWQAGLSPHAPYSVHPQLLARVVALSAAHRVPVAMHLAESREELELLRSGSGPLRAFLEELDAWDPTAIPAAIRPLDYLRMLTAAHRSLVIHGNYLDDEEISLLGEHAERMAVVYCPRTHAFFGHAPYPLEKMLAAGVTVALGTDSRASSPNLSVLAEMRLVAERHAQVAREMILRMATLHGARALGRDHELGSLEPGKYADLAIVGLPDREAADPHDLLFHSDHPVRATWLRGAVVASVPRRASPPATPRVPNPQSLIPDPWPLTSMPFTAALDCWFLTGPTAAGKSGVGVELARRLDAEIVSMDSMALYRGMDIGTAKPTPEQRRSVRHHLVDVLEPEDGYSLAQYIGAAKRCIDDIKARGREALFVGGTALYLKGLLRGIFEGPPADWPLRRQLQQEAREHGSESLHRRLAAVDPAAAARLHPNDTRRLIRALEVYEKTGQPISRLQRQFDVGRPAEACRVFVLDWPREELHARIERRVDEMFAAGLVEEVRGLLARPHALSRTARQAVGYGEVIEHLGSARGLPETIDLVKRHTRQLAKRQNTWFRSLSECRFVAVTGQLTPERLAKRIVDEGSRV